MNYKIGVDGGGTKTEYALFSDSSTPLFTYIGDRSNHEVMDGGIPTAAKTIFSGILQLLALAGLTLTDVDSVAMGLAGMDHPHQIREMKAQLLHLGIQDLFICNDGFLVIKAGSPTGYGIGYNAGTGTCYNAITHSGAMIQLGGLADFSGDVGNANWNAVRTFRAVYDDRILHTGKTMLTDAYYEAFHITNEAEFINSVENLQKIQDENTVPILNRILFECVQKKDAAACRILEEITDRSSDFISCLARNFPKSEEPLPVILSGSVHQKQDCSRYAQALKEKSQAKSQRQLNVHILDCHPVIGAYYLSNKGAFI